MVKKFISVFLVLLYLYVTVGFAVHECGCGNSGKLELLVSESSCTCHNEPDSHCCDGFFNGYCNHKEADDKHDCHCETQYKAAHFNGIVQKTEKLSVKKFIPDLLFVLLPKAFEHKSTVYCNVIRLHTETASPPPLIYLYRQLRL